MSRTVVIGLMLVLVIVLAACGGSQADTTAAVSDATKTTAGRQFDVGEMPVSSRLPVGTLMLEETEYAVTPEQAQELLPLWQMLRALQESGTASQVESEAIMTQIQDAMTAEQLATIEEMSPEDMQALMQDLGRRGQSDSDSDEGGGSRPPEGMMAPGGGEGMQPGMGAGGVADLSPEERPTMMTGRTGGGMGFGTVFTEQVIELLETRAAEG